jgi:hypothetical protein
MYILDIVKVREILKEYLFENISVHQSTLWSKGHFW